MVAQEEIIGTHRVRVDGDTVLTRYIGVPEFEHIQAIHLHFDRVLTEHGRLFVINDMSRTGVPSTRTRRWIVEWAQTHPIAGLVNFGASLPIRTLQTLIMRATALLSQRPILQPFHCDTEAEAVAWIAQRRMQLG